MRDRMFQNKTSAQSIAFRKYSRIRETIHYPSNSYPIELKLDLNQVQQFPILVKNIELEAFFHILNYDILIFVKLKNTIDN